MVHNENDGIIETVKDIGATAKATGKLFCDKKAVEFNLRQDEIDILDIEEQSIRTRIEQLRDTPDSAGAIAELEKAASEREASRKELEKQTTHAYLVPLQYRDYRLVQTAVLEAVLSTEGMNFDNDVRILMVIQEKKLMTLYLALRKYANSKEKFYPNLDAVVKISDKTLDHLYDEYTKAFELTEDERKK